MPSFINTFMHAFSQTQSLNHLLAHSDSDVWVAVSALYSAPAQPPSLEALPVAQDFITACTALGLAPKAAVSQDEGTQHAALDGDNHSVAKGTMYHLQLLLRTFAAVCTYQKQVSPADCH